MPHFLPVFSRCLLRLPRVSLRPGLFLVLGLLLPAIPSARAVTFEIDDPDDFAQIIDTNAPLVTNLTISGASGGNPVESPVWISSGNFLVFSDCVSNKLQKLVLPNTLSDYYDPPAKTLCNGNALDAQERLINCEAGSAGLQVVMITNGVATTLVNQYNGKKFCSPNDVIVKSDGTIWFTDPGYNGNDSPGGAYVSGYYVYRFDPANGNATCTAVVTNGVTRPNGLCFSPDESLFYLADSDTGTTNHHILVYSVTSSNTLTGGRVFATIANGFPDGIRCDVDGRIWSSSGEGVYIFEKDGHLIGKIKYGLVSNLCWGGTNYHTLFMDGYPSVTSMNVLVAGMPSVKKVQTGFNGGQMNVTWPAPSSGFHLQESDQLGAGADWTNSISTPTVTNAQNVVSVPATNAAKFYRLKLN
jgi:gluconolactonase